MLFSVPYYLELRNAIISYSIFRFFTQKILIKFYGYQTPKLTLLGEDLHSYHKVIPMYMRVYV